MSVLTVGIREPVSSFATVGWEVLMRIARVRWERSDTSRATRIT
jgi:hypothetical protein